MFRKTLILFTVALLLIGFGFLSVKVEEGDKSLPDDVVYSRSFASNGVVLHVLQTNPSRISLHAIDENVTRSDRNGINGGFFWEGKLLSIAVNDGSPVNGKVNEFGSGWFNEKYKRGTMVYDKVTKTLSVQRVESIEELMITDKARFWAQGGISMNLQENAKWRSIALKTESLPFPNDERLRSAMVFDSQGEIYLIVSSSKCTAEQFRDAIISDVGENELVDGIFLDGDGSSQLLAGNEKLKGDNRTVLQMISVDR